MHPNTTTQFDGVDAAKTLTWIRSLPVPTTASEQLIKAASRIPLELELVSEDVYSHYLSDGMVLGYLMAALDPSMAVKLEAMKTWRTSPLDYVDAVLQRKRIAIFLQYAGAVGVDQQCLFTVDQLNNGTNLGQVVRCLSALRSVSTGGSDRFGYWASVNG
ncbi:hypothetical protein CSKR_203047 [Clonorchis sinensis]|uniref:Calponin-homology (CH) domain-containing protein n=1 Tax=Clonorchis sinensis TaxID=79923 RepID=A0A8T1M5C2_CLOSI|nr:hypothetical protein CSKR_203047 [Clonorchis sinensis]